MDRRPCEVAPPVGCRCHDAGMEQTRTVLEQERQATLDRLAALTGDFDRIVDASRDSNADDEPDPEGATIADLLALLYQQYPAMQPWDAHLLIAVGLDYAARDQTLHAGDSVSIMPPVQGG